MSECFSVRQMTTDLNGMKLRFVTIYNDVNGLGCISTIIMLVLHFINM